MSYADVRKQLSAAIGSDQGKSEQVTSDGYNTARQQLIEIFGVEPATRPRKNVTDHPAKGNTGTGISTAGGDIKGRSAGAVKTRSQAFNEIQAALKSGKITQAEANAMTRQLRSSGHTGETKTDTKTSGKAAKPNTKTAVKHSADYDRLMAMAKQVDADAAATKSSYDEKTNTRYYEGPLAEQYVKMYSDNYKGMQPVWEQREKEQMYSAFGVSSDEELQAILDEYEQAKTAWEEQKKAGNSGEDWYQAAKQKADDLYARLEELQARRSKQDSNAIGASYIYSTVKADTEEEYASLNEEYREAMRVLNWAKQYRYSDIPEAEGFDTISEAGNADAEEFRKTREMDYYGAKSVADYMPGMAGLVNLYQNDESYHLPTDDWTEEERGIFGYLWQTDRDRAFEYAQGINDERKYKQRQAQIDEMTKDVSFGEWAAARVAGMASGVDYLDKAAEYLARGTVTQRANVSLTDYANAIDSAIAEDLNTKYGTINEDVFMLGGKGWGDAYQLGMSVIDSAASVAVGGEYGSLMMFWGRAASSGFDEAMQRGATPGQALASGFAEGCAEVIFEKFSVDQIIKMSRTGMMKDIVRNILKSGAIEGSEELATSIANFLSDEVIARISGGDSKTDQQIKQLMADGMDYDEAWKNVARSTVGDMAYDALAGSVSGGLHAVGATSIGAVRQGATERSVRGALQEHGYEESEAKELANIAARQASGWEISEAEQEKLDTEAENIKAENRKEVMRTILDRTAAAASEELTDEERDALAAAYNAEDGTRGSVYAKAAVEAYQLGKSGKYTLEEAMQAGERTAQISAEQFRTAYNLGAGVTTTEKASADISTQEGKNAVRTAVASLGEYAGEAASVYEQGQDLSTFAAGMSEAAERFAVTGEDVRAQDGGIPAESVISTLTDAQIVKAQEIGAKLREQRAAARQKVAADLKAARELATEMRAGEKADMAEIERRISEANKRGAEAQKLFKAQLDALEAAVKADPSYEETEDYARAYDEDKQSMETVKEAHRAIRQLEEQKQALEGKQTKTRKKGTVSYNGGNIAGTTYDGVDRENMTRQQKHIAAMIERLADIVNIDYVLFSGPSNMGGAYVQGGVIYININAGTGKGLSKSIAAATLGHELTHFMQEYAPDDYQALKDYVVKGVLKKSPAEFDRLVRQQRRWEPGKTYDELADELVANACQTMLLNDKAVTQMARENMSLAEKVADVLDDLRGRIASAFDSVQEENRAVFAAVKAVTDEIDGIAERWGKGIAEAVENYNAMQTVQQASETAKQERSAQFQRFDDTTDDTAEERNGRDLAYARLQSENEILRETVDELRKLSKKHGKTIEALQKKLSITKTPETRQSDARKLAKALVQEHGSSADIDGIADKLKVLGDYILQTETDNLSEEEIKNRARSIARDIVESASEQISVDDGTYSEIADDIKGSKLSIDEAFLGELDQAGGYDRFRKNLFGRLTLAKRERNSRESREGYMSVDQFYTDMQNTYGKAFFPDVANEGEQAQTLAQMMDAGQPMEVNPYEQYLGEASEEIANRIVMDAMSGVLRAQEPTTMDKQRARTKELQERIQQLKNEQKLDQREAANLYRTIYDLSMELDKAESMYATLHAEADYRVAQIRAEGAARAAESEATRLAEIERKKEHWAELVEKRDALGKEYKEQAFAKGRDREAVEKLHAEMKALDAEIDAAERDLLQNEEVVSSFLNREKREAVKQGAKIARKKYQKMLERAKERRENSANATKYRKQVEQKAKKLYELLMTNSNDLHVPQVLKAPLGEFLESLDFTSKRALGGGEETRADEKFGARLIRIQQMLANQQSYINGDENIQQDLGGYIDVSPEILDYLRNMAEMITTAMSIGRTFTVNQMTAQDLKTLSDFLGNLRAAIKNMNYFMANARYETVKEAAAADIAEMKTLGRVPEKANAEAVRFAWWENGTPYYIMKRLGKGAKSLFDGFAKGWERLAFNAQEIINFTEKTYNDKEVKSWKKTIHDITLEDGSKIQMTTAQIMELSMLLGREQAIKHISRGGIRIGDIETKKGTKHDTTHYHLSDGDIRAITGLLTPRQAEVAKNLQRYMADRGAEWGNEISMRRFGYKFYEEGPGYYPIKTDSNDRPMADTDAQTNSMFRLLNLSASKSLNPKASNALVVGDIFDTFADHMADMAKLNGMGLPVLDAIKWFNYKERIDNDDGTYDTVTLQGAMEQAFGEQAQRYFRTLIKDINGVNESGDRGTSLPKKLMSNYKIASVAANLRVALLQPTSYVRALTVLKPKYMVGVVPTRAAYREAMKYSGTAVWKSLGYYETDISKGLREKIAHDDSFRDKFAEASLSLAELGDQATWSMLWTACKRQAKAESPGLTGDALMEKTAGLFREVVYSSQVMDSTLTRSEIMRGKTGWTKAMSAFMAEPTLSYNILMDAASNLNLDERKYGKTEAWKRNSGKLGKAITVYVASAAFAAVVESIADAVRDDDDEEFWEKFKQALWGENGPMSGNLSQDLTILGKLPYVKNFISTLQGYTSGDMSVAAFNNLVNVYKIWEETIKLQTGALDKATKVTYYGKMTEWGKVHKTLQALSQLSGFAVYNLTRDATAIWNTAMDIAGKREWKIRTYDANRLSQSKLAAYNEYVKDTGVSKQQFQSILTAADANGNGSLTQDELGAELARAVEAGEVTNAQAEAIWKTKWNGEKSKTYSEWADKNTG